MCLLSFVCLTFSAPLGLFLCTVWSRDLTFIFATWPPVCELAPFIKRRSLPQWFEVLSFETLGPRCSLGLVTCQPGPTEFQNYGREEVSPAHRATCEQSGQAGPVASLRRERCNAGPRVPAQGGLVSSPPRLGSPCRHAPAAVGPRCPSLTCSALTLCSLFQSEPQLHRSDRVSLHVAVLLPAHLLWRDADNRQRHDPQRHGRHRKDCRQGDAALWLMVNLDMARPLCLVSLSCC